MHLLMVSLLFFSAPDQLRSQGITAPPPPAALSDAVLITTTAAPAESVSTIATTDATLRHVRLASYVGLGAGALTLIAGGIFALSANNLLSNDHPTVVGGVTYRTISADDAQSASDRRGIAVLLCGVGAGLAAGAGATLLLLPSSNGGSASVGGSF
jgi:hypothetical protein